MTSLQRNSSRVWLRTMSKAALIAACAILLATPSWASAGSTDDTCKPHLIYKAGVPWVTTSCTEKGDGVPPLTVDAPGGIPEPADLKDGENGEDAQVAKQILGDGVSQ